MLFASRAHLLGLLALAALLTTCSRLPDYAKGEGGIVDPSKVDVSDLITYRTLSREDFKADEPPAEKRKYAEQLGALTCAYVMSTPETQIWVQEIRDSGGDSSFEGKFKQLGFQAFMDRKCSWYNPKGKNLSDAYVLQHEQIHFALAELEARRLNADSPRIIDEFRVTGSSLEEVQGILNEKLSTLLDEAMENLQDKNDDFDEETSMTYAPEAQKQWYERVTEGLEQAGAR